MHWDDEGVVLRGRHRDVQYSLQEVDNILCPHAVQQHVCNRQYKHPLDFDSKMYIRAQHTAHDICDPWTEISTHKGDGEFRM